MENRPSSVCFSNTSLRSHGHKISSSTRGAATGAALLACRGLGVQAGRSGPVLLHTMDAAFAAGGMHAVIGPSGCGKTTFGRALLGMVPADGTLMLDGCEVGTDALRGRVGLVPQFSVAHGELTVAESLDYAFRLFVPTGGDTGARVEAVAAKVGLAEHRDKLVGSLSGGQLRRLGLALQLVTEPECLICDEVTSGLDPLSEDEILDLLRSLAEGEGKTLLCVIHNLGQLHRFDTVTLLLEGRLIFRGNYPSLLEYFEVDDPLRLYARLRERSAELWEQSWKDLGVSDKGSGILASIGGEVREKHVRVSTGGDTGSECGEIESAPSQAETTRRGVGETYPGSRKRRPQGKGGVARVFGQVWFLLLRRLRILSRDPGYVLLLAAMTFGFPVVVVIFALGGLPEIGGLSLEYSGSHLERMKDDLRFQRDSAETASLVTGLIMFQAVLLTLVGANNGSREIAAERSILENEKLNGLSPFAYAMSKVLFLGTLAAFQGAWMTLFVKVVCRFPGPLMSQVIALALCCIAMTLLCLGFSALARSTERASLASIYLVGFQLPLSGVVLALPETMVWLFRPFITTYWAWAGYLTTMRDTAFFDAYRLQDTGWIPSLSWVVIVLGLHMFIGFAMMYCGCRRT